ncbi:MAG TPA: hypothetical protein VEX86_08770 [Longimicrobium sp.]|nr:hypothetical protein [Longimicrobium sp.]
MKKLGLKLDDLQVESFEVGTKVAGRGTVQAHATPSAGASCICIDTVYTNNDPTCGFSCDCGSRVRCP